MDLETTIVQCPSCEKKNRVKTTTSFDLVKCGNCGCVLYSSEEEKNKQISSKTTETVNPFVETSGSDNPFMTAPSTNPFMEAQIVDGPLSNVIKLARVFFQSHPYKKLAALVVVIFILAIPLYQNIWESREEAQRIAKLERQQKAEERREAERVAELERKRKVEERREAKRVAELERKRKEEEKRKEALIACNRRYAEKELAQISVYSNLIEANKEGAHNVYSAKQETPYSTTYFDGDYATSYYHDGSYSSQDGIRIKYRIKNNSRFLIYKEIDAKVIYFTKSGSFWSGLLGAAAGAIAGAELSKSASNKDKPYAVGAGALAGAIAGQQLLARNTEKFKIYPDLFPGRSYSGSKFVSASSEEAKSDMKILSIKAEIHEAVLRNAVAPGCNY